MHFAVNGKALNMLQKNVVYTFLMKVNQKNFVIDNSYTDYQVYLSSRLLGFFFPPPSMQNRIFVTSLEKN